MKRIHKESTNPPKGIEKKDALKEISELKEQLTDLQNLLYASKKYSLLIVLQGMDTSGKDGTIKNVFSSINPQGCTVKSFKSPTEEEIMHDFLWRIYPHAPAKGMIQIFNRSHYEDILYPCVHKTIDKKILEERYDKINQFEDNLKDNGTIVLKFFLHISKKEQSERLKERLTIPEKRWKYNPNDKTEAKRWDDYMEVYEQIVHHCAEDKPWHIVPADHKWYRNLYILKEIVKVLKSLKMEYPVK